MTRRAMALAGAFAVTGVAALHFYLQRFELEMAGGDRREVVMAVQDLGLGDVITRAVLDVKELPESYLEERHIAGQDLERVIGARVTSVIQGGGALLWTDLDTMQDGRTLAGLVRVGMRGYALSERDASFDGLLRPGDRVDVMFTPVEASSSCSRAEPPASTETTILLHNVLVLTVGGDLGQESGPANFERSGRVTLSVTPEQATVLARREGTGRLRLVLRNPQDVAVPKGPDEAQRSAREHAAALPSEGGRSPGGDRHGR